MKLPRSIENSGYAHTVMAVQRAALAAVEPGAAVRRNLQLHGDLLTVGGRNYDMAGIRRVFVVGGGKAAAAMVSALYQILGSRLDGGVAITKVGYIDPHLDTGPVEMIEAGHPLPNEAGVQGAQRIAALLSSSTEYDLVLAVISGGGSALLSLPSAGLSLADLQETTDLLLRAGATIRELNAVRKHLSQMKGGGLARLAGSASVASLILSDVVGDPMDVIASGPTVPDPTTFVEAQAVLVRYGLADRVPKAVQRHLQAGLHGEIPDTPKAGSGHFARVHNVIIGGNRLAAEAAVHEAHVRGLDALLLSTFVEGEAREVALVAAALLKEVVAHDRPAIRPACLVWGGETTVTVMGQGKGGRNQELALAAALSMQGLPKVVLVALGTDGTDGPTDAAGAVATGETVTRARALGLDPFAHLTDNNAYPFFDALGDLIRTGPTGTNVNDLLFLFALP